MTDLMSLEDEHGEKFYYADGVDALAAELAAIKRTREQEANYAETCHQNTLLRAAVAQMKEAIYWALGERDEFPPEPEPVVGKYRRRYWWRTELRKRSGLPIGGTPSETGAKPQRCAALNHTDPPQDCDAPFCGCNPEWSKCIEWLLEAGWKAP